MSEYLYELFTTQFGTYLELLLQQRGSKLRGKVSEGFHVGKQAAPINQVGAIYAQSPAGRFAPKNRTDATFTRRWVLPQDKEIDQLIDSFDELKTIVDPKSKYTENAAYAIGRAWDDRIIYTALNGCTIGTDANGLSTENMTSTFQIADSFGASTGTGLTVAKIIETRRILEHYQNDLEMDRPTLVIGSKQHSDLLNQAQVVSTQFNEKPVLVDGMVKKFLGFDIVVSERLATSGSDRLCIAFVKSGMYLGLWKELTNRVSIRNDLSGEPFDLYTSTSFDATRTQLGKVIQIAAVDSTGSDITP